MRAGEYRIAARALCDFTAREGDLDHRFTPSPSAREGIAGHALVAGRRGEGYEAGLTAFFETQCRRFLAWAGQEAEHRLRRDAALRELAFPHAAFRPGQRELAEGVYKAAATGRSLLSQAPTGIGKTLGTLFPMLAALPCRGLDRIAFLTMKTPGRRLALAHEVCPYYLGQELARWCDVAVGDVNHWFDHHAMLHGLARANEWRLGLLVDEAHNLVERARGMYSAELDQRRLNRLRRSAPPALTRPLGRLARQWQQLVRDSGPAEEGDGQRPTRRLLEDVPKGMLGALQRAVAAITDYLGEHPDGSSAELQELLFEALAFCQLAEQFGDHSLCDLTRRGRGREVLGLRNLVPADFLAQRFAAAHSAVLFSATLSPGHYHRDLLGLPADSVWQTVASPFAAEQLEVRIRGDISTRLRDRERSAAPIVDALAGQYRQRPGHYLAFFSSFAYLAMVLAHVRERHPDVPVWAQTRGMQEAERDAFLARFRPGGRGIGFAVLGGAFAEGIDLPGDRLIGAFIATLGLPPADPFNEALKARLETRFGQGDDYTYRIPGLIKVVQAAGRVIRGPEDRGTVVLMDDRFARPEVKALLPGWWCLEEGGASRPPRLQQL